MDLARTVIVLRYLTGACFFLIGLRGLTMGVTGVLGWGSLSPTWREMMFDLATPVFATLFMTVACLLWPNAASTRLRNALWTYLAVATIVAGVLAAPYFYVDMHGLMGF